MHHPQIDVNIIPVEGYIQPIPRYATELSAGFDFYANIERDVILVPGSRTVISSGLKFEIPVGYELQVRSRSGLTLSHGIVVANSPGTVDADYRNVVGIILTNIGFKEFTVEPGMRIAQGVISPVVQAKFNVVKSLSETNRGEGGFGSTGV